jgi:hypothetical protein
MHLVVDANSFASIDIMSFGRKDEVLRKFRVTEQVSNALYDIPTMDLISVSGNSNFLANKTRATRKFGINDFVKFTGVFIRELKSFLYLNRTSVSVRYSKHISDIVTYSFDA